MASSEQNDKPLRSSDGQYFREEKSVVVQFCRTIKNMVENGCLTASDGILIPKSWLPPAILASYRRTMAIDESSRNPTRLEGKLSAKIVCWILGLGSLVAWNIIPTIGDYYYQLFPKYHPSRVLTLVHEPFSIGTIALLAYNDEKLNTRQRNLAGYIILFLGTISLLLLDLGTLGKGGLGNYIGICASVASLGVANALVQGGIIGDLSFMCTEFIQSFLAGSAASGALISVLRLVTKAAFEHSSNGLRKGVILFLAISTFFQFLCIILYAFVFPKLPIVQYYRTKAASEGSKTVAADLAAAGITVPRESADDAEQVERLKNKKLFTKNIDYALEIFLVCVVTSSIFPGFLFENTGTHNLGSWYPTVLIVMYNVWDLISRYIPLIKKLELKSRKGLMIATLSRFLLVPCFYFTAKYGDQGWMIMLVSFLGLTNGYLNVCVFTAAPKGYKGPEANALGNILVLCLLVGVLSGLALGWLWLIGNSDF